MMNDTNARTNKVPGDATTPLDDVEGDFATGERTEPEDVGTELHEGDFAAGERTTADNVVTDPDADLHGDFAAGGRTEPLDAVDEVEGTFADTNS